MNGAGVHKAGAQCTPTCLCSLLCCHVCSHPKCMQPLSMQTALCMCASSRAHMVCKHVPCTCVCTGLHVCRAADGHRVHLHSDSPVCMYLFYALLHVCASVQTCTPSTCRATYLHRIACLEDTSGMLLRCYQELTRIYQDRMPVVLGFY